jgi:hypothetical protein
MIGRMPQIIWMSVGAIFAVAVGIWALARWGRAGDVKDLGSISDQWVTEHRTHDREWRSRGG